MRVCWRVVCCTAVMIIGVGISNLCAQDGATQPSVLHIEQSQTTSPPIDSVPTFLATYHVLGGAKSPANLLALKGTLSLKNDSPNFSQVLWVLVYWQGECPEHDIGLKKIAGFLWFDITKNASQSNSQFPVNLRFPNPIAATGCIGFYYGGGPVFAGKATMTADLDLTYQPTSSINPNTVINGGGGEYCFGQTWNCQNATDEDEFGFAVPIPMKQGGHLLELFGNISDSTFDGTNNFGPLPTGKEWGAINEWYLLHGGCGEFGENLNLQGFPNPLPLSLLYSWLPDDALPLESVPLTLQDSGRGNGQGDPSGTRREGFLRSCEGEFGRLHGGDFCQERQWGDGQRNTGQCVNWAVGRHDWCWEKPAISITDPEGRFPICTSVERDRGGKLE